MGFFFNF